MPSTLPGENSAQFIHSVITDDLLKPSYCVATPMLWLWMRRLEPNATWSKSKSNSEGVKTSNKNVRTFNATLFKTHSVKQWTQRRTVTHKVARSIYDWLNTEWRWLNESWYGMETYDVILRLVRCRCRSVSFIGTYPGIGGSSVRKFEHSDIARRKKRGRNVSTRRLYCIGGFPIPTATVYWIFYWFATKYAKRW